MKRWLFIGISVWFIAVATLGTVTRVEAASTLPIADSTAPVAPMSWNSSPATIVMQVKESGGIAAPQATELPLWTLYGDGYVVWTENGSATPGFSRQVWTGTLTTEQMNELVAAADELGFWAMNGSYSDSSIVAAPGQGIQIGMAMPDQRSAAITVNLTDRRHSVVAYPPSSASVPDEWRTFREQLLATRPANGVLYQANTFQLRARVIQSSTLSNGSPVASWPFTDIVLLDAVTQAMPLGRTLGTEIGNFLIANHYAAQQGGATYNIRLFVTPPRLTTVR